jgi:hypothetical protein
MNPVKTFFLYLSKGKNPRTVIRIALIHKGMVFLKENRRQQLDYPFELSLKYRESLDNGVKRVIRENGGSESLPYRYAFRYLFENEKKNRLIFFYVSNIKQEKLLDQFHSDTGKWWTGNQVQENLNTGIFSECFEKEYELLQTILDADRLMHGIPIHE